MSSTHQPADRRRVAGVLLALGFAAQLSNPPEARAQTFDITGVWRDENANADDKTTPVKESVPGGGFHGTYRSRPYLQITQQDPSKPQGPFFIYSDVGDLRAELRPVPGAPNDLTSSIGDRVRPSPCCASTAPPATAVRRASRS